MATGSSAIFTNETCSFYRQYENNLIGIGNITTNSVARGVLVKNRHYDVLRKEDSQFECLYVESIELKEKIENTEYLETLKRQIIKHPLWWEEIQNL